MMHWFMQRTLVIAQGPVGAGEKLPVILQQVAERAASGAGIAGHPDAPARRGILYVIVGRVDPDQLTPNGYQFRHNRWFSVLCKVKNYLFSLRNTLFLFVWFSIHDQMEL